MEYNNANVGKSIRDIFNGMNTDDLSRHLIVAENKKKEQEDIINVIKEILKERM